MQLPASSRPCCRSVVMVPSSGRARRAILHSLCSCAFSAFAGLAIASAEKRVGLVIGNADYKAGRLANPVNDAEAIAEVLEKRLKLDKVILKKNLGLDGLRAALREMARSRPARSWRSSFSPATASRWAAATT
jgi:hypothetical protein